MKIKMKMNNEWNEIVNDKEKPRKDKLTRKDKEMITSWWWELHFQRFIKKKTQVREMKIETATKLMTAKKLEIEKKLKP